MDQAFSIFTEYSADGTVVFKAGAVQVVEAARVLQGRSIRFRRISIQLMVAVENPSAPLLSLPRLHGVHA